MWQRLLAALTLSLILVSAVGVQAQSGYTARDAINVAAQSAIFRSGLAQSPGWTAAAYYTKNTYGIWRVQFWNANGEDLGWADVSPARRRVYSWDQHFAATAAQQQAAEPILRAFVAALPDVIDLLGDPTQYAMYVDYDAWNHWWGVTIDSSPDTIWVPVQFAGKTPDSLDDPQEIGLYFDNVLSYEDWQQSQQAIAIATAFQNADIAAAVRRVDSWTTAVEHDDDNLWTVKFMHGETELARVQVDLTANAVVDFSVSG